MRRRGGLALLGASALSALFLRAEFSSADGSAEVPDWVLAPDTDLLLLPGARRPPSRPEVTVVTRIGADPRAVAAVVLNPSSWPRALPTLVRADVVSSSPGRRPDSWPDRLIAWELEVPLFNLTGRAWLRQWSDGAELTLVEGAFAPGRIHFRIRPASTPSTSTSTILTCELQVEIRSASWIFRKVARHDPWAETAISAATAWVLARAMALGAEASPGGASARPRGPIQPPPAAALDGTALGHPALAALRAGAVVASVRRAPGGRLAWSSAAVRLPGAPQAVAVRLATPESWRVFPGWKSVTRKASPPAAAAAKSPPAPLLFQVEDDVSLVDLDAVWSAEWVPPASRATAVGGDIRGAVLAWQTMPGDAPASAIGVLSMHPRLDAAGFVERRLVQAEPLLEHALAVAMVYANAAAVADSFDQRPAPPLASPGR